MSRTHDATTKAKVVRLFKDHVADYESPWAAMKAISGRLGMTTETLRRWVRESEVTPEQQAAAESAPRETFGRLPPWQSR